MLTLWSRVRDGTLSHDEFRVQRAAIRQVMEGLLLRGLFSGKRTVTGSCREWWTHRECLWRFVDAAGVEPTNHASERVLRPAVIWRKLSFGTQSRSGSRFGETVRSVIETCRPQQRNAFTLIRQAVAVHFAGGEPAPSLLAKV